MKSDDSLGYMDNPNAKLTKSPLMLIIRKYYSPNCGQGRCECAKVDVGATET